MISMTTYTHIDSPLGQLLLTSSEGKLSGLYFADQPHARISPGWVRQDDAAIFVQTAQQLEEYASGERESFDLPLSLSGTPFQVSVWNAIAAIPFGQTITYSELAQRVGSSQAARAVGTATGQNPVCWIVPCHRVMGKGGALTGYAGGIARKSALLEFEGAKSVGWEAILAHGDKQSALALV
jgi:methylated-DNA-[protein]-cysteine S-methyltransferase